MVGVKKMDAFRDTQADFFEDLKRGHKDINDFERYQQGSSGTKSKWKDDRDLSEAKEYKE